MTDDIVLEAVYPHPPSIVWRAIATKEGLDAWLMSNDFEGATLGHRFELRDKPRPGFKGVMKCEIIDVQPERRLSFRFGDGGGGMADTTLTWELEPVAGGTRVRFRHAGFTGLKGWLMRAGMVRGWTPMVRWAMPFLLGEMAAGRTPTQAETRAMACEPKAPKA